MKRLYLFCALVVAIVFVGSARAVPEPGPWGRAALHHYFPGQYRTAKCVAYHESGYDRFAVSPTGDYGYMQINRAAHGNWVNFSPFRIFNITYNVAKARRIYLSAKRRTGNGWSPWSAYWRWCR